MRHLHDRVRGGGRGPLPALHAHVPHGVHRRLAHAQSDLPQLPGAGGRRTAHQLRDQLTASALKPIVKHCDLNCLL